MAVEAFLFATFSQERVSSVDAGIELEPKSGDGSGRTPQQDAANQPMLYAGKRGG